jgi:hypothetical protein
LSQSTSREVHQLKTDQLASRQFTSKAKKAAKSTTSESRLRARKKKRRYQSKQPANSTYFWHEDCESAKDLTSELSRLLRQLEEKYFDYFVFNIVDYIYINYALPRLVARHRVLAQTIGNARGLDINSSLSAEAHTQGQRFHRHQQRDDPNSARGLDNNFASDRGYDSTTTTRLRHRRLQRADHAAPDKS